MTTAGRTDKATATPGADPVGRLTFIPDILEEHLAEIAFLWSQRREALRSPEYSLASFTELEGRIAAHLQGVLVIGERALDIIGAGLESEDTAEVFASAFALLNLRREAETERVFGAFISAEPPRRDALRDALSSVSIETLHARLAALVREATPAVAAAAGEVLAFHGKLEITRDQLFVLVNDDDAAVRVAGWRLVAYTVASLDATSYAAALRDEEPAVRHAALLAGAWCGEHGVLELGRNVAAKPTQEHLAALQLFAILAAPKDGAVLRDAVRAPSLGNDRFRMIGSLGSPQFMDEVLSALGPDDPARAAAAGAAFAKMTGIDITSTTTATVAPADGSEPDEFDAEFLDEVALPDAALARREWKRLQPSLGSAGRICRGTDVSRGMHRETFAALDMESRWEACLRGRFWGGWKGTPVALEIYPQRR